MTNKYKKEFKEEVERQIVQLGIKKDFLKNQMDEGKLKDDSEENVAKVKIDIDALEAKIEELQELHDFIKD